MIQLKQAGVKFTVSNLFKLEQNVFGATQHTPIYYNNHIYGVRFDGQFVCLDMKGKVVWNSTPANQFGLGPFLMAGGTFYVLSDKGKLSLIEATPERYNLLAQMQVLSGHEAWGPMALAGRMLLARDLTRLVCLDVGGN